MVYIYDELERVKYEDYLDIVVIIEKYNKNLVKNYITYRDRLNNIVSIFMLMIYLYKRGKMKQIKTYKINQNNKPIMMDIRFNISHCSAGVAVAIDGKEEVGIDIESEILNYEEIKCNVLSDEELDTKNMNERLFRKIWTLKESYIKYNGIGMNIDLKEIDFSNFLNKDEFIKYNLHFNCYENEKYNLAICCKKTLDIRCMKYEELKRYINLLK